MDRKELREFLLTNGYKEDRWGHMVKDFGEKLKRYKFQKISVRIEMKSKIFREL